MNILGSDQIWARELTHGFDPAYFGQFAPGCKKISYAASVPNGSIPENVREKWNSGKTAPRKAHKKRAVPFCQAQLSYFKIY